MLAYQITQIKGRFWEAEGVGDLWNINLTHWSLGDFNDILNE